MQALIQLKMMCLFLYSLFSLTLLVFPAAKAQQGLVNCESFSSGFTTPEGCIDGSQPSSGPIPANQDGMDDDWGDMPFGWYGPGDWMDF